MAELSIALHPAHPDYVEDRGPSCMEAEQALIGAVLFDNEAFHLVDVPLEPRHFFEGLHGRLWAFASERIGKGVSAEPIGAAQAMGADVAFKELGALGYLMELVDHAPQRSAAAHFAGMVLEQARRRDLIGLAGEVSKLARAGEPASDVVGFAESALLAMQASGRQTSLVSAGEASARVLEALDNPSAAQGGILTGLGPLDAMLGPLLPGDLVLFMGRPSMGKSAAAECVALNMARFGHGVIQINGEMSPEQMARRHLTDLCFDEHAMRGPKYSDIRKRAVGQSERAMLGVAHELLHGLPLTMLKRPGLKLSQLRSLVRRQAAAWVRSDVPLGALIVDHVGLLKPDQRGMDRYEAQTEISNGLKELADELGCVVIGLNQMNRENERRDDKRPQLSDLRDSGSWEQDADFVVGWYREAYYAQREPEPADKGKADDLIKWADWDRRKKSRTIEAIVLKAREGETGKVDLWGDVARNAIRGAAPENDGGFL